MIHRAAMYRVYVRELYRPDSLLRLGNLDGRLAVALRSI